MDANNWAVDIHQSINFRLNGNRPQTLWIFQTYSALNIETPRGVQKPREKKGWAGGEKEECKLVGQIDEKPWLYGPRI